MKKRYVLLFGIMLLQGPVITALRAQSGMPSYPMKFRFRDAGGQLRDTIMPRAKYVLWSKSHTYPDYVQWKGQPFAVLRSELNGVGLFTDSLTGYTTGQQVGLAFAKRASSGLFSFDYIETNLGSFMNDSQTPNMDVELTAQGIVLRANQPIAPHTELTASYRDIIALFPNDETVVRSIKYW